MSLTTYPLTIDLLHADGSAVSGALIDICLTIPDVSLASGQVVNTHVQSKTDNAGRAVVQLWSNLDGSRGSQYRVRATDNETGKKIVDETVTMPPFSCHLRDIVLSPAPSPLPYDEASVLAIQQARAEAIEAKDDANQFANAAALSLESVNVLAEQMDGSLADVLLLKDDIDRIDQELTDKATTTATHATEVDTKLLATTMAKDEAVQAKNNAEIAKSAAVDAAEQASTAKEGATQVYAMSLQVHDDARLIAQQVSDDLNAYELIKTQTQQAATSANTALAGTNLVHQAVINERVIVTDLKDQCATHELETIGLRDSTQLLLSQATSKANTASTQADIATTKATTATEQAAVATTQAGIASNEANRATTTVNSIAEVLAEMATAVINTQTIILSRGN